MLKIEEKTLFQKSILKTNASTFERRRLGAARLLLEHGHRHRRDLPQSPHSMTPARQLSPSLHRPAAAARFLCSRVQGDGLDEWRGSTSVGNFGSGGKREKSPRRPSFTTLLRALARPCRAAARRRRAISSSQRRSGEERQRGEERRETGGGPGIGGGDGGMPAAPQACSREAKWSGVKQSDGHACRSVSLLTPRSLSWFSRPLRPLASSSDARLLSERPTRWL